MQRICAWVMLATLVGCDDLTGPDGTGTTDTGTTTGATTGATTGVGTTATWRHSLHPCAGNRTDTMWWDTDDTTVWVGCGTTTTGYGLFQSTDGGLSWAAPATEPAGYFDDFRVDTISRSSDGWLYVGGTDTSSSDRVVRIDTDASPHPVELVFASGGQIWNTFQVGTYRRNDDGLAVAESLTGTGLVYRADDAAPFEDGSGWWPGTESFQILDMVLHDQAIHACGSTISQPPHVFLPAATDPFQLTPVQLADFSGELWGLDVDADGIVAAGVDQERNIGMAFVSGSDPTDPDTWAMFDVSTQVGDTPSWFRGTCRSGATIVLVGEYSMTEDPLLVISTDGGQSFTDHTDALPGSPGSLHRCKAWPNGRIAVTGKDGYFAGWE